jgi:RNA polymerase sigma-70 factor (ECF subfamily)
VPTGLRYTAVGSRSSRLLELRVDILDVQAQTDRRLADLIECCHDRPALDDLDAFVDVVADDQLRLMFLCCHPALSPDAQVALTLRPIGGLDTSESPRAFLGARNDHGAAARPGQTHAARQPRRLRCANGRRTARRPPRRAVGHRALFTEGHTATSGEELVRTDLSNEAIPLGRVLVELLPDEPEAVGLLTIMLLTDARRADRLDAHGSMVRLATRTADDGTGR